jgi:hypothetical protein
MGQITGLTFTRLPHSVAQRNTVISQNNNNNYRCYLSQHAVSPIHKAGQITNLRPIVDDVL